MNRCSACMSTGAGHRSRSSLERNSYLSVNRERRLVHGDGTPTTGQVMARSSARYVRRFEVAPETKGLIAFQCARVQQVALDELDRGGQGSDKVRPLAVTSATRFQGLPDLPALNETLPGVVVDGWFGLVAPIGTSPDIVTRVNRESASFSRTVRPTAADLVRSRHRWSRHARVDSQSDPRDAGALARARARA
jgi:hypothetical protein